MHRRALILLLAAACAGPSHEHKASLSNLVAARDWDAAVRQMQAAKARDYAPRDEVLYWLDLAALLHEAGRYRDSDEALDAAEVRLDALYTQSISKGAATFFVNDAMDDYRGEPHERALLHILRALNHAYAGDSDEAAVEARKVNAFLSDLSVKTGAATAYRDDAFAQYLSALLYEDTGHADDARISYDAARAAYASYSAAYATPASAWAAPDATPLSSGEGEVVFLHYAGLAPRRRTHFVQIAWNDALIAIRSTGADQADDKVKNALVAGLSADAINVAFPEHVQDPYSVTGSEIEIEGQRAQTVMVEDISAIAQRALADRIAVIRARAIARAAVKFILAKVAEDETEKHAGKGWGFLAGVAARATSAALEQADTRCWSTIPAQIRMARIRVPAGEHVLAVHYASQGGPAAPDETLRVRVTPGRRTYVHVRTAM